jgi:hypothetical protein
MSDPVDIAKGRELCAAAAGSGTTGLGTHADEAAAWLLKHASSIFDELERLRALQKPTPGRCASRKTKPVQFEPYCHAGRDGACGWRGCPQIRENEPHTSGRHCPFDRRCDACYTSLQLSKDHTGFFRWYCVECLESFSLTPVEQRVLLDELGRASCGG